MTTILGIGYALVESGDVSGLQNALSAAASDVNSPYSIFLKAGTYSLFSTLVIYGQVRIYGSGRDTTIIQQGQRDPSMMAGIFTLNGTNSVLELYNLTVKDGLANAPQFNAVNGAGIKIWAGIFIAEDCKFDNNDAANLGGAISNVGGKVSLKRVLFINNNAASGGAIYTSSLQSPALTIENARFDANGVSGAGGAIASSNSPGIVISNSTFLNTNTAGTYPHISNSTPAKAIDARTNYWLSSPQVSTGVTTSPTASSDPTATMPVTTPEQKMVNELLTYGITAYVNGNPTNGQNWNLDQLHEVVIGVQNVARAFNLLKYGVASGTTIAAKDLFHSVNENIRVLYVTNGFNVGTGDPCNTVTNKSCTSNNYAAISFIGGVTVDQYTLVHELGHRFDNRSDQSVGGESRMSLTERLSSGGAVIKDCDDNVVMGIFNNSWERGKRGWGSNTSGNFQKDALEETGTTLSEVQEGGADMFLNWVYRYLTDNILPAATPEDACNNPLTGSWQGFLNVDWTTGQNDLSYPGNRRYQWMHETMATIFGEHPWM